MLSIQSLFKETKDDVNKKHFKRIAKKCHRLKNAEALIPHVDYPTYNSDEFKNDINEVVRCMHDKCLSRNFLDLSHKSVKKIYKNFLNDSGYKVNWGEIKDLLDEADSIVLRLKYKYKRDRPKHFLANISSKYQDIHDSKSFSFPSGHTALAYFLSRILEYQIPELSGELTTLAEMIGQSRIENGVHYPTDVAYGKLVGEIIAESYNSQNSKEKEKDAKQFSSYLRNIAGENINDYVSDFAEFIYLTNKIENYNLNYFDCKKAAAELIMGFPVNYITENPHINSTLNAITKSFSLNKIDSLEKILDIHRSFSPSVIEKLKPGSIRTYPHFSPTGTQYSPPNDIVFNLKKCCDISDNPVVKHIVYEWIHPFGDGNGRSGRVILASDLDYNFKTINSLIGANYIKMLDDFMSNNNMNELVRNI